MKDNGEDTTLRKAHIRLLEIFVEVDRICRKHDISYWIDGGTTLGAIRHGGFIPWDDDIDISMFKEDYIKLMKVIEAELSEKYALQNTKTEKNFYYFYSRVVDKHSFSDYGKKRLPIRNRFKYKGVFLDIFYVEKGNIYIKKIESLLFYYSFRTIKIKNTNILRTIFAYFLLPCYYTFKIFLKGLSYLLPENRLIYGCGIPFKREFRRTELLPVQPVIFEGVTVSGPNNPHNYLQRIYGNYMVLPPESGRVTHAEKIRVD